MVYRLYSAFWILDQCNVSPLSVNDAWKSWTFDQLYIKVKMIAFLLLLEKLNDCVKISIKLWWIDLKRIRLYLGSSKSSLKVNQNQSFPCNPVVYWKMNDLQRVKLCWYLSFFKRILHKVIYVSDKLLTSKEFFKQKIEFQFVHQFQWDFSIRFQKYLSGGVLQ